MTINKAYLVALRATVTLTSIPGMAPGPYDMFPDSFPGYIGPFPPGSIDHHDDRIDPIIDHL